MVIQESTRTELFSDDVLCVEFGSVICDFLNGFCRS